MEPFLAATIGKIPVIGALFSGKTQGPDIFTASVILAIMILPYMATVFRDLFLSVPTQLRESAYGMGSTPLETVWKVMLPYISRSAIGAVMLMLGLGRALGETIAVTMVIGNTPQIRASLFAPAATIPSKIASSFREASSVGLAHSALLGLAVTLLAWTFILALISRWLVRRTERIVGDVILDEDTTDGGQIVTNR